MRIFGYLKKFGTYSFKERRLSDVDALIFTELGYINFHLLLNDAGEIMLKDITDEQMENKDVFVGSVDAKKNKKMLNLMRKSKRYGRCVVKKVVNVFSHENENQFYAMLIVLPNKNLFIDFRGTDTTLIGWKEDFKVLGEKEIIAQKQAHDYMNEILMTYNGRFYVGGHSKGGNLAFYAAMHLSEVYNHRFIGAYSFEGPGFTTNILDYPSYEMVKTRLIKYLTFNTIIGAAFKDIDRYRVVYSSGILGGHDPFNWQIHGKSGRFRLARDISNSAKRLNGKLMGWIYSLSIKDRLLLVEAFFTIFGDSGTIYDLFRNFFRNLFHMKKSLKGYTDEEHVTLKMIFKTLVGFLFAEKRTRRILIRKNKLKGEEGENDG